MSPESVPDDRCPHCGTPYGKRRRCYRCNPGGSPKAGEIRQCQTCGQDFYAPRWKLNDAARNQGTYCSRECKNEARISVAAGEIQCTRCGLIKPADDFGPEQRKQNGKKSACQECERAAVDAWRQKYPERYEALKKLPKTERQKLRRRDRDLRQKYGMSLADYQRIVDAQGGGCAVCRMPPSGNGRSGQNLHIDHDHRCCAGVGACGRCIRGLLCGSCNTLIGLAGDDPERLLAAARYLRTAEGRKI